MAMSANRQAFDLLRLLDKSSYRVYRLRTDQNKSFREIGAAPGVSSRRARQLYDAGIKRIELKKCGGDVWPEFSLSLRAVHCIEKKFGRSDVHKREVIWALKRGKLLPGEPFGYGWKTHREVCAWAGVAKQTSEL